MLEAAETNYPVAEKLALAVLTSARELRPYFQSLAIVVMTSQPLRIILHSPNQSGRHTKWAIEQSEYDIEYKIRTYAKSQVLADFIIEIFANSSEQETEGKWTLKVDGASSSHGSGIGIHLKSPTGEIMEQSFRLNINASNNESEYKDLIAGLRLANEIGAHRIATL